MSDSDSSSDSEDFKRNRWLRELDEGEAEIETEAQRIAEDEDETAGDSSTADAVGSSKSDSIASMSLPSEPQLTLGRKKVNAYDTMRRTGKRMKRKLSGELAHENSGGTAPINNQFQVKAFAAQFELEAAKQKQSQLKTKMEDLAQVANSKEIELEKALAKIKALEEEAKRANAHKELEAATKAAQVERKKADEMEEAVRKMRLEREELERKRLEVEKLRKELEDKERAELSSSDGVSRSNSKGGLSSSGGSKRLSKSGKRGSKGEKGEKGDSSANNINVTLQAPGAQSQAPIIIQQADDGRNAMLLNSQAAHILSLQEQSRLDAERRRLADEERRQQERDAKKRDKEEKRKRKKLEEEKRRQQLRAAQLASDRERQMEIDAELRRQAAEIEDEKRRLRQRSGLEWFRNYYNLACKANTVRECSTLTQLVNRAIRKNKSIYDLDLFSANIDVKVLQMITKAFQDTFNDIEKMDESLELVDTIDPHTVNLRSNFIKSGRAIVDLCVVIGNLTNLDISNTQLGPRGGAELAEGLYDYKSLTVFKCGGNGFGPNAGNLLLKALAHQKGLKWLDIGDNGLNDKCCPALAQLIEVQPFESLVIRDNKFKDGMKHVIRAIEACTTLRDIDFTNTAMNKYSKDLMTVLEARSNVRRVCIGFNKPGKSFEKRWKQFVSHQECIDLVDLRYIDAGSKTTRAILESVTVHLLGTLVELTLNGNLIDKKALAVLLELVEESKVLSRLALRCCGLKEDGMISIANSMQANTVVKTLDLAGNKLKSKDAYAAMDTFIRSNKTLQALGLAALKIDKKHVGVLADALRFNTGIQKFHIGGNKLGDQGLVDFVEGMAGNEELRILVIKDTDITHKSLIPVLKTLTTRTQVQVVDASENDLPKTQQFSQALSTFPDVAVRV